MNFRVSKRVKWVVKTTLVVLAWMAGEEIGKARERHKVASIARRTQHIARDFELVTAGLIGIQQKIAQSSNVTSSFRAKFSSLKKEVEAYRLNNLIGVKRVLRDYLESENDFQSAVEIGFLSEAEQTLGLLFDKMLALRDEVSRIE